MTLSWQVAVLAAALFIVSCNGAHTILNGCPLVWNEPFSSQYVKFYLYTRDNGNIVQEYVEFAEGPRNNISSSRYRPDLPNVVLVHGYGCNWLLPNLQTIKDEYLRTNDLNVWFLDWAPLCPIECYETSVLNLEYVGKFLALFVNSIGNPNSGLHVIGYSLGGHAAAFAANHLKPYLIPRITGLDPALPLFTEFPSKRRLSPDDGQFVDVIHTNAFFLGNFLTMGHVDFFLNGGTRQPGCGENPQFAGCSHDRSGWYYAESVNSGVGFWGLPCDHYPDALSGHCRTDEPLSLMGAHVDTSTRGIKYVETSDRPPYAKGKR